MRTIRAGHVLLCVLFVVLGYFDIFWLHRPYLAVPMAFMVLVMAAAVTFATRIIHLRRAELRCPDYVLIASMELEIFGRTFDHGRGGGAGLWT